MKFSNYHKTVLFYLCLFFALFIAFGFFPLNKPADKSSSSFSAERVADDIRVISKEHHSIQHPKERKVVRDYLFHRLEQMGGATQRFEYDSITCKFGGYFNIENIYSVFNPNSYSDSTTSYILLVAHMDSRYFNQVLSDTVYSYGAADDGYGLGVILESVNVALKYKKDWAQGIKVLFTDAEEHELDGMTNAVNNNPDILKGVNFVINVEARGVKGPALLFETAKNNQEVLRLYKNAKNPAGFSLTTLVYRVLPNDTDFTLVKDSLPGLNFAVIDNLHYYHTNLDNYSSISLSSIQHYGNQMEPIVKEYLTSGKYSSATSLQSNKDVIFFCFPVIGMFTFSKLSYWLFNLLVFALFALAMFVYVKGMGLKFKRVLYSLGFVSLFAFSSLAVGTLVAYLASLYVGLEYDFVGLKYVKYDNIIAVVLLLILILWCLLHFRVREKKSNLHPWESLLGVNSLLFILSFILLVTVTENFFVLLPLFLSCVAMLFSTCKYFKWLYLLSSFLVVLIGAYFLNMLYIAITLGSIGLELFIGTMYIWLVISQYYCLKRSIL